MKMKYKELNQSLNEGVKIKEEWMSEYGVGYIEIDGAESQHGTLKGRIDSGYTTDGKASIEISTSAQNFKINFKPPKFTNKESRSEANAWVAERLDNMKKDLLKLKGDFDKKAITIAKKYSK